MRLILALSILLNLALLAGGYYALQSLGGPRYVLYKMKNRGTTGVYGHRKMQLKMLATQSHDIVMLGNSITEQGEWAELLDNPNVKNRGIAGDGTNGLLDRLSDITEGQPKQIFLMIGINDLLFHDAEFTLANYETIVERIQKETPQTELILQNVLPTNDNVRKIGINKAEIKKLNHGIQQIAEREGLTYLNLYDTFRDINNNLHKKFTDDGIHLNGEAYLIWRDELREYIN
ncbi:MAG: GDSL-type esterase/lipase family protein [Saprospiraceae bacterium]